LIFHEFSGCNNVFYTIGHIAYINYTLTLERKMKVTLDLNRKSCAVEREKTDKKFYDSSWSSSESQFLYAVLQALKAQGLDVIKKRMWKDGHMVDDTQLYIRTKKWGILDDGKQFAIYNQHYAIYDAGERFNEYGEVVLGVVQ